MWRDSDGSKEISLAAVETTITATGAKSDLLFESGVYCSNLIERSLVHRLANKY